MVLMFLFSLETESLTYKLLYNAQEFRSKIDRFAEKLAGFSSRYPDVQFKVIITDRDNTSEANPTYELSSNPLGNQDVAEIMRTRFASVETDDIIDCFYENTEQYYKKYYTSDLHWHGFGVVLSIILRTFGQAALTNWHDQFSNSDMSRYLLLPHSLSATYFRRAATSMRALFQSGNVPTTRVLLLISRFSLSMALFVRMRLQCSIGDLV